MALRPPRPCGEPGCPELVQGVKFCESHQIAAGRADRARRGSSHARGYNAEWRKKRKLFLKQHPFCEDCAREGNPLGLATVVDHRIDHKGNDKLFWDETNWRPLCARHHNKRVDAGDFGRPPKLSI